MQIAQIKANIISNKKIAEEYFKIIINSPQIARQARPGQFVNLRVSDTYTPLLRRPFSIHRVRNSNIEILYEVIGKGTELLSKKQPKEQLDILGALGNGFNNLSSTTNNSSPILVAGGMGVAPLIFLAEKLAEIQNPNSKFQNLVLIGTRTKDKILCEKEFKDLGCEVRIATDDGSKGFKGKVTDLLKKILAAGCELPATGKNRRNRVCSTRHKARIYACGPKLMLKEISKISVRYKIPAYASLEEIFACGIGACLGCAIDTKQGYKMVCKDGPVFNLKDIKW